MSVSSVVKNLFYRSHDNKSLPYSAASVVRARMWERLRGSLAATNSSNTVENYMRTFREFCEVQDIPYGTPEGIQSVCATGHSDVTYYINWARQRPAQKGRSSLISDKVSLATVKKKALILSSVFDHLVRLEFLKQNPFKATAGSLRKHKAGDRRDTRMVPFEKIKEIFSIKPKFVTEHRDLAIMAVLFGGALRRREAVGLRMMDIHQSGERLSLTLRNTKKQRSEKQAILSWAVKHIVRYAEIRREEGAKGQDPLFVAYRGTTPCKEALSDSTLYHTYIAWMERVGLDDSHTPHSARATAITLLLERGKHHRVVQKFSRHASIEMVVTYDKRREEISAESLDDVDL